MLLEIRSAQLTASLLSVRPNLRTVIGGLNELDYQVGSMWPLRRVYPDNRQSY